MLAVVLSGLGIRSTSPVTYMLNRRRRKRCERKQNRGHAMRLGQSRGGEGAGQDRREEQGAAAAAVRGSEVGGSERARHRQSGFDPGWMEDPRFKPWLYNIANHGSSVLVAFDPVITLEHEAVIGGFKCLYHLTKKEHAHHTNYADLLELAALLGCQYFHQDQETRQDK
ncbi:hypothetical protein NQZ68_033650 [Dissostichus eleginoides]|nr:hypothetical protein NQZ68_033650 [Dissostichus eleginoides]